MADPPQDVTLGEVWRGVERLTSTVEALRDDVIKEVESQVVSRMAVLTERVARLEKVIYPGIAVVLTAVITAVLGLVLIKGGSLR
jgi:hypothetical protein